MVVQEAETKPGTKRRRVLSLVELAVVLVTLGVLAIGSAPYFFTRIECSKAAAAFRYLADVQTAQETYRAEHGVYSRSIEELNLKQQPPKEFSVNEFISGGGGGFDNAWSATLVRGGGPPAYGPYTIVFTQAGFDGENSSIVAFGELAPSEYQSVAKEPAPNHTAAK